MHIWHLNFPVLLALFVTGIGAYYLLLNGLKKGRLFQPIYELAPNRHQEKSKTPSMGGLAIMAWVLIGAIINGSLNIESAWCLGLMIGFAIIGFIDDRAAIRNQANKGLSARQKFGLQCLIAGVALGAFSYFITPLEWMLYPWYGFIIVGTSNATNLTDGMDGHLTGLSIISLAGFYTVFLGAGLVSMLGLIQVMILALLVFLVFNHYPAKWFMGDTGSLAIGAALSGLAILSGNVWLLLPFGLVYIIETLSVVIQVAVYKRTRKRVFLMAPIHHHFEMLGLKEPWVVYGSWGLGLVGVAIYLIT